ncbi:MAG: hypothetical protein WDA75_22870 [Candidatus Latescibacterota bacterium]|jgi:hypothetical protein
MPAKLFWESRTFWANAIAILLTLIAYFGDREIPAEAAVSLLAMINLVLRLVTNKPIVWSDPEETARSDTKAGGAR